MKWCQLALFALQFWGLSHGIKLACEGADRKPASGFQGVMIALVAHLLALWLLWGAGAFSEWIP